MPVTVVQTIADKGDRLKGHLVPTNSYCITHVLTSALLVPFALLTHCRAKREECSHTYCDNCRNKKIHSSFIIQFTAPVVGTPKSLHHISNILTVSVTAPSLRDVCETGRRSKSHFVQTALITDSERHCTKRNTFWNPFLLKKDFFFLHQICITFFWGVTNIHLQ